MADKEWLRSQTIDTSEKKIGRNNNHKNKSRSAEAEISSPERKRLCIKNQTATI
ncbi:hypothetical protein RND71_014499 [Anisodus tanguticus]|uniref:Uncharacterized protein n=1 Tax=Anisodus tanguticus TaxID=243964 RepID=A0AAE1SBQ0_9SOLA|nr:hypothetical protein RND71_014499 [Anisodus tanguticus]